MTPCWLKNSDAADVLGVTTRTLYRMRKRGQLLPGVHYHRTFQGKKSLLFFDIAAVRGVLQAEALLTAE